MRKLLLLCILVIFGCRAKPFPGDSSLEAALKLDWAPASCRAEPFPGDSSMGKEDFWVYDPATCRKYYVFTSNTNEAARVDIVRSNIRRAMSIVNYSKEEARAAFFVRSSVDSDVGLCALFSIEELLDIGRASETNETNARDMIANHHWHEEKTPDINEIWPQESE